MIFALIKARAGQPVDLVIDINPAKQGRYCCQRRGCWSSHRRTLLEMPQGSLIPTSEFELPERDQERCRAMTPITYVEVDHGNDHAREVAARHCRKVTSYTLVRRRGRDSCVPIDEAEVLLQFHLAGRPIIQYPQDIVAMQELIWDVKPDLIIETGIAHGGSLVHECIDATWHSWICARRLKPATYFDPRQLLDAGCWASTSIFARITARP